jgi:hypothetical protein
MSPDPEGILHITVTPTNTSSRSNMGIAQQLLAIETVKTKLLELYTTPGGTTPETFRSTLGPGPGFAPRKLP